MSYKTVRLRPSQPQTTASETSAAACSSLASFCGPPNELPRFTCSASSSRSVLDSFGSWSDDRGSDGAYYSREASLYSLNRSPAYQSTAPQAIAPLPHSTAFIERQRAFALAMTTMTSANPPPQRKGTCHGPAFHAPQ